MKKVGVYFNTNYFVGDYKSENVLYNHNNKKLEITEVELVEFKNGYLKITYKTNQYKTGQSTYHIEMKYVESYYIF